MANQGNSGGGPVPWPAPNIVNASPQPPAPAAQPAGFNPFGAPQQTLPSPLGAPQAAHPTVAGTLPFTRVNNTTDQRVLWEDGKIAIIFAGDFPANTGMGRSQSRKTLPEAINAQIDPTRTTPVGAGSRSDLVKVWLAELLARPVGGSGAVAPPPVGRLPNDSRAFNQAPPAIAKSGTYKGMVIPDYPHDCARCGGKMYQGMFGAIHPTPDGRCPAEGPTKAKARR